MMMKLTFPGTKGNIDPVSRRHRRHSTMRCAYRGTDIVIDCGEDWLGHLDELAGDAVLVTHAHPDHAFGLRDGAPAPVYATREAWETMRDFDIEDRHVVPTTRSVSFGGIDVRAFTVQHSTRAPAVGYRITAGAVRVFYVPDLVYIHERSKALDGVELYIGDGATVERSMVRKPGEELIGHTPIRTQLTWCRKEGVPEALFTHCGSAIVAGDERTVGATVRRFAEERGVRASIAHDGMERVLR
jgi:phosphoribosyl 1,2-cyclic phosphodiesterase